MHRGRIPSPLPTSTNSEYTPSPEIMIMVLPLIPLVIGGLIAAVNSNQVNEATEKAEAWARVQKNRRSNGTGWFSGYVLYPFLWAVVGGCDLTNDFSHRGLKNGARVAGTLYLFSLWLFLLYVAFSVVVGLILFGVALYIVAKLLSISGGTTSTTSTRPQRGSSQKTGLFSSYECDHCGSTEHATGNCPHSGIFSSNECDHCGSTDHATSDCPNSGIFTSNECDHCGSTEHATSDCPQSGIL